MKVGEQIIQVLEYLCEKFGIVINWSEENVLPMVQKLCEKYIRWEVSTSISWLILGVIMLIIGFMLISRIKAIIKRCDDDDELDSDDVFFPLCVIASILSFIAGTIIVGVQTFDIIKCCVFPELQIYEDIKYLSQGM